jgi:hypothetical protein
VITFITLVAGQSKRNLTRRTRRTAWSWTRP